MQQVLIEVDGDGIEVIVMQSGRVRGRHAIYGMKYGMIAISANHAVWTKKSVSVEFPEAVDLRSKPTSPEIHASLCSDDPRRSNEKQPDQRQ